MTRNISYKLSSGESLFITTYGYDSIESKPCIIFVHGFKGFKDWGFGPYLSSYFANKGFFVITFNFSHNGIGKDSIEFTELDKFSRNSYSLELDELNEVIKIYRDGFFGKVNNDNKLFLVGHSRGGGVSILSASNNNNVDACITWSSISNVDRFSERQKKEWKSKGSIDIINSRTLQIMKLGLNLLEDIEQNANGKLNILDAVANMKKPLLLIHGEQDLAVPLKEAEMLYNYADKSLTEFIVIEKAGHTFDIKHPFEGTTDKFEKVLDATYNFITKNFSSNQLWIHTDGN